MPEKKYSKSEALRSKILESAGHHFKARGYEKTTFQAISDELSISKSTISYHFKSKPQILFTLFVESMAAIRSFVVDNADDGLNSFKTQCITQVYFYRKIMDDKRLWTLFYSVDHRTLWINEQIFIVEGYFKDIMNDFKKDYDESELHAIAVMNLGAKLSMFKEFEKNPGYISVDRHCYYIAYLVGLLSKLDEATISKNIKSAFDFVNSHKLPPIAFWD